jgi:hypothetical protein
MRRSITNRYLPMRKRRLQRDEWAASLPPTLLNIRSLCQDTGQTREYL